MPTSPRMKWPYPAENQDPWYEAFKGLIAALDASGYAAREDRNIICTEGGTISWVAPVLTWSSAIKISAPITGFLWQVAAGSVSLDDGQVLYVTLTRGSSSNLTVTVSVSNQVPSSDQALVLAIRMGSRVYLRSGVSIEDGDSITEFCPSPGGGGVTTDRYAPAIIVGNSPAGDTLLSCHYLDTGNGAQLAAAITAAAVGALKDVYVRPGTYNLNAVGGPSSAIVIPDGVRVRGAGSGITVVRTRGSGDQRAFELGQGSKLEDVSVLVTLPTGVGTAAAGVVSLLYPVGEVRRVDVDFLGTWTGVEAANFAIEACFYVGGTGSGTKLIDCRCGIGGDGQAPSIWTLTSGAQRLYGVLTAAPPQSIGCDLVRFRSLGCDEGISAGQLIRVRDAEVSDPELVGVRISGTDSIGSEVTGTLIEMDAAAAGRWGILLSATSECDIEGNLIVAWTGNAGARGIGLEGADDNVLSKNRLPTNWGTGIDLDFESDGNIVSLNMLPGCLLANAGANNVIEHNRSAVI